MPGFPTTQKFWGSTHNSCVYQRAMIRQRRDNCPYLQRAVSQNLGFRKSQGHFFGKGYRSYSKPTLLAHLWRYFLTHCPLGA